MTRRLSREPQGPSQLDLRHGRQLLPCVFKLRVRKIVMGHRRQDSGGYAAAAAAADSFTMLLVVVVLMLLLLLLLLLLIIIIIILMLQSHCEGSAQL